MAQRFELEDAALALPSEARVELVCSVLASLSLRDQLSVRDVISSLLLKRDFLTLLPPELVAHVLACLPPRDALRCVRVSRQWRSAVLQCASYWKGVCARLGIPPEPALSWTELARGGMRLQRRVKRGSLCSSITFAKTHCKVVNAEPGSAGVFIVYSVNDSTMERDHFISIHTLRPLEVIMEDGSLRQPDMVEEAHVGVSRFFRLQWCHASQRYVKLYGSNGECFLHTRQGGAPATREWAGPIVSPSLFVSGSCPSCPLMALAGKALPEDSTSGVWPLQLLKPWPAPSTAVDKFDCHFEFLPDTALRRSVFYRIRKLALLPSGCLGEEPFCSSHRVLVQIGFCVVVLGIESDCGRGPSVPQQLAVLRRNTDPMHLVSAAAVGSYSFQLSTDNKLLGMVIDRHLYCWDLDSFSLTVSRDLLSVVFILALGRHFSVFCGGYDVRVVSTATGGTLFYGEFPGPDATISSPFDQAWLDTPDTSGRFLELATVRRVMNSRISMARLYLE